MYQVSYTIDCLKLLKIKPKNVASSQTRGRVSTLNANLALH